MSSPNPLFAAQYNRLYSPQSGVTAWRPAGFDGRPTIPAIGAEEASPILPDYFLWDYWPLADEAGMPATVLMEGEARQLWFFLSAPRAPDPEQRHHVARIRLLSRGASGWHDHGPALPAGWSPGSREWAGCAVLASDGERVTLYFTAAGRRAEGGVTFEQRLFVVRGRLRHGILGHWSEPEEVVAADGRIYAPARQCEAVAPGMLKAFRDPFWLRDPATGLEHVVFTGSAGWSSDPHNGVIGLATRHRGGWQLEHPLVEAVGVNNELERPQLVARGGRYYLFWSTQAHTFAPTAPDAPTGLYGMTAASLRGPWRPLNGSGLVAANPAAVAEQVYSWCVTSAGEALGFVAYWGTDGDKSAACPESGRRHFGGTPAPVLRLAFAGDQVRLV